MYTGLQNDCPIWSQTKIASKYQPRHEEEEEDASQDGLVWRGLVWGVEVSENCKIVQTPMFQKTYVLYCARCIQGCKTTAPFGHRIAWSGLGWPGVSKLAKIIKCCSLPFFKKLVFYCVKCIQGSNMTA